jgi:hypothetical protein
MNLPSRALFVCWLAMVLTGTVVTHRHIAPLGHTHGFGWVGFGASTSSFGSPPAHRHLILLGIELGATPAESDSPPGESCGAAAEVTLVEGKAPAADSALESQPMTPGLLAAPATNTGSQLSQLALAPYSLRSPLLSHARSGILRL